MSNMKKQMKITKLVRSKGPKIKQRNVAGEDLIELHEEIKLLEVELRLKQRDLFEIQRSLYRSKLSPSKPAVSSDLIQRPKVILLNNSLAKMTKDLNLVVLCTGIEVQSYKANDHCCVVYHMQHPSLHEVKHRLTIDIKSGKSEVTEMHLPLGFNIDTVIENFPNVMTPEFHRAVRRGLVAYYDRLEQLEAVKKFLRLDGHLVKNMDGSHVQISFCIASILDLDEDRKELEVELVLTYALFDIRPKKISMNSTDVPDEYLPALEKQCSVFKYKPLRTAFREAFLHGDGPYALVQQFPQQSNMSPRRRDHGRLGPDDTFHPDQCSEEDTDDEE